MRTCGVETTDRWLGLVYCQRKPGHKGNHRFETSVEWPDQWNAPSGKRP